MRGVKTVAYDGIAVSNIVYELKEKFTGGRIDKIYQPRNDEIIFSVRSVKEGNFKVLLSANSMNPRIHIPFLPLCFVWF